MHPLARPTRSQPSETQRRSDHGPLADSAARYVPPRYGQAAAIYALYQAAGTKPRTKPPQPRKPGGGKLARWLVSVAQVLRGLTPATA